MDGAGPVQRFWHVTLPMLVPVIFVNTLLAFSGAFVRNFDIVYVLTKGGPNHATEVVLTDMVTRAFTNGQLGYASAMGYVLFLIVGLLSVGLLAPRAAGGCGLMAAASASGGSGPARRVRTALGLFELAGVYLASGFAVSRRSTRCSGCSSAH
jgi:ABC-type Fe3+ transport system permease subunit